jgi:hypothetical protein
VPGTGLDEPLAGVQPAARRPSREKVGTPRQGHTKERLDLALTPSRFTGRALGRALRLAPGRRRRTDPWRVQRQRRGGQPLVTLASFRNNGQVRGPVGSDPQAKVLDMSAPSSDS